MYTIWSRPPVTFDKTMLWAACCLAFFGFMRCGEFTSPSPRAASEATLRASDVSVDSRANPQVLIVWLRHSKADPFGAGMHLYLGRTGDILCPVTAMLGYLAIRPATAGPLFVFHDNTFLSRARLVTHMRETLSQAGIQTAHFSGHSFRIGAASAAARAGCNDSLIQTLGRWKSDAFTAYIRTPPDDLAAVSKRLARC